LFTPSTLDEAGERGAGLIAYEGLDGNIYTIDRQGANRKAVTDDARLEADNALHFYQFPTWSPDSSRLAFLHSVRRAGAAHNSGMFTARPDGSELAEAFSSRDHSPFYIYWSPDSSRLTVLAANVLEGGLDLLLVPPGGGEARVVARGQPFYWAWSPRSLVLFIHTGGAARNQPGARLSFLDLESEGENRLDLRPGLFQAPAWSPGRERLLLAAEAPTGGDRLMVIDPKGAMQSELLEVHGFVAFDWSPDGKWVAYLDQAPGSPESVLRALSLVDPERPKEAQRLTAEEVVAFFWSPDSQQIAYLAPTTEAPPSSREGVQNRRELFLRLLVYDLRTEESRQAAIFTPTSQFLAIIPYFDQYQRSATIWSPDSRNLVVAAVGRDQRNGIYVLDAHGEEEPRWLVGGDLAFWSWK
ncbi:MAG TPA: hypothetical protein VJL34_00760, partial [Anaerolineales bacterium]|nr:hypothetical protein [Anaerolineales bacterium]